MVDRAARAWSGHAVLQILYNALLAVCLVYAIWRGGAPERWGAAIIAAASIGTRIAISLSPHEKQFRGVEWGMFAVDAAALVAFAWLALRARRLWPLWVAALQLVALCCHLARMVDSTVLPWAYAIILGAEGYVMLVLVMAGTHLHQRRKRAHGTDRSWTNS